jgi:hypothetical protein
MMKVQEEEQRGREHDDRHGARHGGVLHHATTFISAKGQVLIQRRYKDHQNLISSLV